jgi:hypothetical protein
MTKKKHSKPMGGVRPGAGRKGERKAHLSVRIPGDLYSQLLALARQRELSTSQLVTRLLAQGCQTTSPQSEPPPAKRVISFPQLCIMLGSALSVYGDAKQITVADVIDYIRSEAELLA